MKWKVFPWNIQAPRATCILWVPQATALLFGNSLVQLWRILFKEKRTPGLEPRPVNPQSSTPTRKPLNGLTQSFIPSSVPLKVYQFWVTCWGGGATVEVEAACKITCAVCGVYMHFRSKNAIFSAFFQLWALTQPLMPYTYIKQDTGLVWSEHWLTAIVYITNSKSTFACITMNFVVCSVCIPLSLSSWTAKANSQEGKVEM